MRFPLHIKKRIQPSYMLVQEKSKINNNGIFYSYPNTYNVDLPTQHSQGTGKIDT